LWDLPPAMTLPSKRGVWQTPLDRVESAEAETAAAWSAGERVQEKQLARELNSV